MIYNNPMHSNNISSEVSKAASRHLLDGHGVSSYPAPATEHSSNGTQWVMGLGYVYVPNPPWARNSVRSNMASMRLKSDA